MNLDLVLLLVFALLLGLLMYIKRDKVAVEKIVFPLIYIIMYKTKIGLEFMDKVAKRFPKFTRAFGFLGVIFGFLTMIIIFVVLTVKVYGFLFNGDPTPIAPLLPGIQATPEIPILGFWHWIISIFILATVHEFSHGWLARLHDVKVKSSGFAVLSIFLPVVPAAFVEPDEEKLNKISRWKQLEVLAAGSFSNYIVAFLFLILFLFAAAPALSSTIYNEGIIVREVHDDYPANLSGMNIGEEILSINNIEVNNFDGYYKIIKDIKPGDQINILTNVSSYSITTIEPPENFFSRIAFWRESKGYIGVTLSVINSDFEDGKELLGKILSWISLLFYWLFTINLAVGMFNMLPLGPIDGGKMFLIFSNVLIKNEKKAKKLWVFISFFCLALILLGLMPFIFKLFNFLFGSVIGLIF